LPDSTKESTQTKRDTLVLQVGGCVDGPSSHQPGKNMHAQNLDKVLEEDEINDIKLGKG